ncbi:hypothetical protein ACWEKM_13120 [Streptomyces sp. NPDC004752]
MLGTLAVALGAAFVLAPRTLAAGASSVGFADQRSLVSALSSAFVDYWNSGDRGFPPSLERVVDYWFWYHVAKAVIAALLLIVLVALGVLLWKTFLRAGDPRGRRAVLASAGALVTMLALFSLAVVMANIHGAVAPFASLISMLPLGASDGRLAETVDQIRQQLTHYPGTGGHTPPALAVMVDDYARFHEAMVVLAVTVALVLIGMSAISWTSYAKRGSSDRRTKRVLGLFGVVSALSSLAVIVVAVANWSVAADPAPPLLAFFNGGW